jgi:hypothetical protein
MENFTLSSLPDGVGWRHHDKLFGPLQVPDFSTFSPIFGLIVGEQGGVAAAVPAASPPP